MAAFSEISRRLPVKNRNDELGELSTTFNSLLERLEVSFQEYFVHLRHAVPVSAVRFAGGHTVQPTGAVLAALHDAEMVAIAPSNPILSIGPRASILWGSFLALLGIALVGVSFDFYGITLGFALASLGFGLYRPGFNAGASLAVRRFEQGDVAGKIASINGSAYIVTPAIGIALFNWWEPATFLLMAAALLYLIVWGRKALDDTPKPLDS